MYKINNMFAWLYTKSLDFGYEYGIYGYTYKYIICIHRFIMSNVLINSEFENK